MKANDFYDKVITQFTDKLTDRMFLMIQSDRELMQDYLDLLSGKNRMSLNGGLAKAIKKKFLLKDNDQSKTPDSTLIKSYMRFKK